LNEDVAKGKKRMKIKFADGGKSKVFPF